MLTHWKNPQPPTAPFYAVIFISKKSKSLDGYARMDDHLMELSHQQEGFLGYSSASGEEGGIFISYWQSEEDIERWRQNSTHITAKQLAAKQWYDYYHTMITRVESSKIFDRLLKDY